MTSPDWLECARISDLPLVDAAFEGFLAGPSADNATYLVRAILEAAAPDTALLDWVMPILTHEPDAAANGKTAALAGAVLFNVTGREAIKMAMDAYDLAKEPRNG